MSSIFRKKKASTAVDMTTGSIVRLTVLYALPLLFGNLFQLLYNTVDVLVVGNFVGTEALAAVGSTTPIINVLVLFFNGFSIGAGVVISKYFGAHDPEKLHQSIETTMAATFLISIAFTLIGVGGVPLMLRIMAAPEDVTEAATTYLTIYFAGISGLLIYNMCSGILRAVGDSTRPLLFLIFTSLLNIVLDLLFVLGFHMGVAGVGYATVISQVISAVLTLLLLTWTRDIYRLRWRELRITPSILRQMLSVGLPTAVMYTVSAASNVFLQSYVNYFGSACMAGWGSFTKLEQFVFLPMNSLAAAATTFVSQNIGAGNVRRANEGTKTILIMMLILGVSLSALLHIAAVPAVRLFSSDEAVIWFGVYFIRHAMFSLSFNAANHVLAASLRGRGDGRGPMTVMLLCYVVIRQTYMLIGSHLLNDVVIVSFAYPMSWVTVGILQAAYYYYRVYVKGGEISAE